MCDSCPFPCGDDLFHTQTEHTSNIDAIQYTSVRGHILGTRGVGGVHAYSSLDVVPELSVHVASARRP